MFVERRRIDHVPDPCGQIPPPRVSPVIGGFALLADHAEKAGGIRLGHQVMPGLLAVPAEGCRGVGRIRIGGHQLPVIKLIGGGG